MSITWRTMDEGEPLGEGVPIFCKRCADTGTIPSDQIFVDTVSHYGIDYRSEEPCPDCSLGTED